MMDDQKLERLLRSAAQAESDVSPVPPFGFETRVVALWRESKPNGVATLLQSIAAICAIVLVISGIAAAREMNQRNEIGDSVTNEYAIADSAIQTEFGQ